MKNRMFTQPIKNKGELTMLELLAEKEAATIEAIKIHIDSKGFWRAVPEVQAEMLRALLLRLNIIWDTEITLICDFGNAEMYRATGGGTYHSNTYTMTLYKASIMTFLHEYGHALQGRTEEAARLWSHRMFKGALPRTYQNAVETGMFFHTVATE